MWGHVSIEPGFLRSKSYGKRYSRQNGNSFELRDVYGKVNIRNKLGEALPWLAVLSLRGAGAKKSFGLGRVQITLS
jgi:hypothetical protein